MEDTAYIFRNEHRPALQAGAYKITATWNVSVDHVKQKGEKGKDHSSDFVVAGERFSLAPAGIHSVYPPEGSRGTYEDCLPHIVLARDTLPWERTANGDKAPWLALLLLHENEAAQNKLKSLKVKDYFARIGGTWESDSDLVQVIELPQNLIVLLPDAAALSTLCHVRANGPAAQDESVSVVVSSRLPKPGRNTVHLVSLQDRYVGTAFKGEQATCTLISLKSWSFTCEEAEPAESQSLTKISSSFSDLKNASWLRLPPEIGNKAQPYTSSGFVPVPHRFRTGESGVSWYSGPLIPATADSKGQLVDRNGRPALKLPAEFADELLWYEQSLGMLTITYAAAWELGRMLVLQNRRILTSLQNWRREHICHAQALNSQNKHLPQVQRACACPPLKPPAELKAWIDGLRSLQGVPFKYLVPDERMLPKESLRFFIVDSQWIDALLDGALSVARMPTEHEQCCQDAERSLLESSPSHTITGFLLRSAVVAGWPRLNVTATGDGNRSLEIDRQEKLSPSILFCLFNGKITSLYVQQPPETLHLSIEGKTEDSTIWKKSTNIWKEETKRILNIGALNDPSGSAFATKLLRRQQKLHVSLVK